MSYAILLEIVRVWKKHANKIYGLMVDGESKLSWHELQQYFYKAIIVSVKESIVHTHAGTVFDMN